MVPPSGLRSDGEWGHSRRLRYHRWLLPAEKQGTSENSLAIILLALFFNEEQMKQYKKGVKTDVFTPLFEGIGKKMKNGQTERRQGFCLGGACPKAYKSTLSGEVCS